MNFQQLFSDLGSFMGGGLVDPVYTCPSCHFQLKFSVKIYEWQCVCGCRNPFGRLDCGNTSCVLSRPLSINPLAICGKCGVGLRLPDLRHNGVATITSNPPDNAYQPLSMELPKVIIQNQNQNQNPTYQKTVVVTQNGPFGSTTTTTTTSNSNSSSSSSSSSSSTIIIAPYPVECPTCYSVVQVPYGSKGKFFSCTTCHKPFVSP